MNLHEVETHQVRSVYTGKAHKCCCGCAGKHRYSSLNVAQASADRGYEVTPDEVNDRQVVKVLRDVQNQDGFFPVERGPGFFSVDVGGDGSPTPHRYRGTDRGRTWTVYHR